MPVAYSQNLGHSLQRAARLAEEQNRKYATPEDLLIALTDDPDAAGIMRALLVDFERLRRDLLAYMQSAADEPDETNDSVDIPPDVPNLTSDLRHILQHAFVQVHEAGRDVATGADVLIVLLTEPAGHFLQQQGVTYYDATRYVSHGIRKGEQASSGRAGAETPGTMSSSGPLAEVRILNDDYTPMEFVVHVLEQVFEMDSETATRLMLEIRRQGAGMCGVYPYHIAQAKTTDVLDLARKHQHPLQCVLARSAAV
jgi:ATP-dependent Clp protease adaptor protein ClpS